MASQSEDVYKRQALQFAEKGIIGLSLYTDRSCMHNLAIDEVGREPMDAKHFGTGINAIPGSYTHLNATLLTLKRGGTKIFLMQ